MLKDLPQGEGPDAIGQWGPLVAILLVLVGAWIKGMLDERVEKQVGRKTEEKGWSGEAAAEASWSGETYGGPIDLAEPEAASRGGKANYYV